MQKISGAITACSNAKEFCSAESVSSAEKWIEQQSSVRRLYRSFLKTFYHRCLKEVRKQKER